MTYVFGKLVTPAEQAFLKTVLKETDRVAQVKHFKAIYATAQRNNTSLENAHNILENNKKYADDLNTKLGTEKVYFVNVYGEICKSVKDKFGNSFVSKLSDDELKSINDGVRVNKPEEKVSRFKSFTNKLKRGFGIFKEMLKVY